MELEHAAINTSQHSGRDRISRSYLKWLGERLDTAFKLIQTGLADERRSDGESLIIKGRQQLRDVKDDLHKFESR